MLCVWCESRPFVHWAMSLGAVTQWTRCLVVLVATGPHYCLPRRPSSVVQQRAQTCAGSLPGAQVLTTPPLPPPHGYSGQVRGAGRVRLGHRSNCLVVADHDDSAPSAGQRILHILVRGKHSPKGRPYPPGLSQHGSQTTTSTRPTAPLASRR
jgi:hypothetical protein